MGTDWAVSLKECFLPPVLQGTLSRPHIHDGNSARTNVLHLQFTPSSRSSVLSHACHILSATRITDKDHPRLAVNFVYSYRI